MEHIDSIFNQLAQLFNSNHINWALGGSLLLKLSGINVDVNDIDIMIQEKDFELCINLLKDVSIECEVQESEIFKTKYYRKFKWDNIEIDCMSGMCIHGSNHIFDYQFDHKEKDIKINHTIIPLCYIEDWYILYHLMPNRETKVRIIEQYFKHHSVNQLRFNYLLNLDIPYINRVLIDEFIQEKMNML